MDTRPVVLDLYCCQGGAGKGYDLSGFRVIGVDQDPQPRYPFEFVQMDVFAFLSTFWDVASRAALVPASPPCQFDSETQRIRSNDHPDLIGPTRIVLDMLGRPYVMENVRGAVPKLRDPVMLCGTMFGLETYRHRYFETGGGFILEAPDHPTHTHTQAKMGRPVRDGQYGQYIGNYSGVGKSRKVMEMPWASREGIREAIPPKYTQWIGERFMDYRNQ